MKEIQQKPTIQKLSCVGLHIQRYSPTKEAGGICKAPAPVSEIVKPIGIKLIKTIAQVNVEASLGTTHLFQFPT